MLTKTRLIAGAVLCGAASAAFGLGFGRTALTSSLGQPLSFAVTARLGPGEDLTSECIHAEVQAGDNRLPAPLVRAVLRGQTGEVNERAILVTTTPVIDEPIVTVTVTLGCPPSLSRSFVAFVDPVSLNLARSAPASVTSPSREPAGASSLPAPVRSRSVATPVTPTELPLPDADTVAPRRVAPRAPAPVAPPRVSKAAAHRPREAVTARNVATPEHGGARLKLEGSRLEARSSATRRGADRAASASASATTAAASAGSRLAAAAPAASSAASTLAAASAASSAAGLNQAVAAAANAAASAANVAASAARTAASAASGAARAVAAAASAGGVPAGGSVSAASAAVSTLAAAGGAAAAAMPGAASGAMPAQAGATDTSMAAAGSSGGAAGASGGAALAAQDPRLNSVEESLRRLRTESEANQKTLLAIQAQLRDAQEGQYANPLVYLLALLCLLLGGGLGWLIYQRGRERARAAWWAAADGDAMRAAVTQTMVSSSRMPFDSRPQDLRVSRPGTLGEDTAAGVLRTTVPSMASGSPLASPGEVTIPSDSKTVPLPSPAVGRRTVAAPLEPAPREISVEELIDLEQQVDFFVVLGQDESAIELLLGHLRGSGANNPLPYLKLLDIYQRRGERESYERVRERFNQRFNAVAPPFGADPDELRDLEGYGAMLARLQFLWADPSQALDALEEAIFTRSDASARYDLPAYRDLLFLYSLVRDLAASEATGHVDVLLPMGDDDDFIDSESPLLNTMSVQANPAAQRPLEIDFDVSQPGAFEPSPSGFGPTDFGVHLGEDTDDGKKQRRS